MKRENNDLDPHDFYRVLKLSRFSTTQLFYTEESAAVLKPCKNGTDPSHSNIVFPLESESIL